MFFSLPAIGALLVVSGLALFPDARVFPSSSMAPDRATLWLLLASALVLQVPPLWRRLTASRSGATWVLLCAFFVLFHLADRAGPREGFSLHFGFAPDDPVVLSWATWAVLIGALGSLPLWIKRGGVERFMLLALAVVSVFGLGMFSLLSNYYKVGATETLDPGPMATLLGQVISYGALALCCASAVEDERVRPVVLRVLPLLLLIVAARHQFARIPAPKTDE